MINYIAVPRSAPRRTGNRAWRPSRTPAFTGVVSSAMNSGIPVLSYNADGIYKNGVPSIGTNRLAYVGQALYLSGQAMGEQIKTLRPGRAGHIAIFIATPREPANIQPRFDGAKAAPRQQLPDRRDRDHHGRRPPSCPQRSPTCSGTSPPSRARSPWTPGPTANLAAALAGAGLSIPGRRVRQRTPRTLQRPVVRQGQLHDLPGPRTCRASCRCSTCTCTTCPAGSWRRRTPTTGPDRAEQGQRQPVPEEQPVPGAGASGPGVPCHGRPAPLASRWRPPAPERGPDSASAGTSAG